MALPEDQLKSIHDLALENAQKDDATRSVGAVCFIHSLVSRVSEISHI